MVSGTSMQRWLYRFGFALLSLIAPAMILYTILYQNRLPTDSPDRFLPERLAVAIGVASVFWIFTVFLLLRRSQQPVVRLLCIHGQVLAITMVFPLAYQGSWEHPPGLLSLSIVGFYFLAPLTMHLHTSFPVRLGSSRQRTLALPLLYLISGLAVLTWLSGVAILKRAGEIYTIFIFTASIGVLVYAYLFRATTDSRRRLRVIWFGTVLAIMLTNIFFFVPGLYRMPALMPVEVAGLLLILVPISYLYAISTQNLFGIDRLLNRSLVYFILSSIIFFIYLLPLISLYRIFPVDWLVQAALSAGLTILIGWNFIWLRARIERLVDRLFYGGGYDYPAVVDTVSDALARSLEREQVEDVITRQVPRLMHLKEGELSIGATRKIPGKFPEPCLSFPFTLQGDVQAIWWVPGRIDGEDFSAEDRRILKTLAQQAEIALNNVFLVDALRSQLQEIRLSREYLALVQRQLMRSREDERSRLARDLHDGPIQALVGLNLQLGMLIASLSDRSHLASDRSNQDTGLPLEAQMEDMRGEVRGLLSELRELCAELRPPMLDMLGLGAAVQNLVGDWSGQHGIPVEIDARTGGDLRLLPDEVAVNLYRVAQEALANVARHASASKVSISIQGDASRVAMQIQDDGKGFLVPATFDLQAERGHFGLTGMRERMDLIGGEWILCSEPGRGTEISVRWPKIQPA